MNESNYTIHGLGLRERTKRECKKTGEPIGVVHERLRQFPEFDTWVSVDEVAAAFKTLADNLTDCRLDPPPAPGPFETIHALGVQLALTTEKKIKVFFDETTPAGNEKKAVEILKERRKELLYFLGILDIFEPQFPNYCPTCPAYVADWIRTHNRRLHMEWCFWTALFEGKSKKPVRLERYDSEYPTFKRYQGRKLVPCPLIRKAA